MDKIKIDFENRTEFLAVCTNITELLPKNIILNKVYTIMYIRPLYYILDEHYNSLCLVYDYKKYFTDLVICREQRIKEILNS